MTEEPESLHDARAEYHHPPKDVVPNARQHPLLPEGLGLTEVISYEIDEHGVRREVTNAAYVAHQFLDWEGSYMNRQAREAQTGLLARDIAALRKGGLSAADIEAAEQGWLTPRDIAARRRREFNDDRT